MIDMQLRDACRQRAAHYYLLARVFRVEVDESFLSELKSAKYPQNTGVDEVDDAYRRIVFFLSNTTESTEDALAVDYARTFLGSGALDAEAAYPYESVYTSPKGLLMQDSRDEVLAIYRSEGVNKSARWCDPEDHLACELEFMGYLCERTAEALESSNETAAANLIETQKTFMGDHLLVWVPAFSELVPRYSKLEFYPAFAQLLRAFLREERALLDEILEEPVE